MPHGHLHELQHAPVASLNIHHGYSGSPSPTVGGPRCESRSRGGRTLCLYPKHGHALRRDMRRYAVGERACASQEGAMWLYRVLSRWPCWGFGGRRLQKR